MRINSVHVFIFQMGLLMFYVAHECNLFSFLFFFGGPDSVFACLSFILSRVCILVLTHYYWFFVCQMVHKKWLEKNKRGCCSRGDVLECH